MNKKGLIVAGAIAVGVYLLSQGKSIFSAAAPQTTGQRTAQKVSQKVDISRLPVARIRYMIAHAAALKKTREEVAALRAEEARRVVAWKAAVTKKKNEDIKKKQISSKLFPGSEKSRVIPYSESSKHSYYGPKSHKVLNEGYMEKRYKADLKQAEEDEMHALFDMFPEYSSFW